MEKKRVLTQIKPRVRRMPMRVPVLELGEEHTRSEDAVKRMGFYHSAEWQKLRSKLLKTKDCRKCFFCGAWSTTLEHLIGHGKDAVQVAALLGLGNVEPDWEKRFWVGPFCGTCDFCARSRSGSEKMGRLHAWTERWLSKRCSESQGAAGTTEQH